MATKQALLSGWDTHLIEWTGLLDTDTDADIPDASFPDHPEMTIQLMEVTGTSPGIAAEMSNNLPSDTPRVYKACNTMQGSPINLQAAGDAELIQESGISMRPRVTAGTGVTARVRIKFTRIR